MMTIQPFYADGLRFSCQRCSSCCRHESGFVYLSENDLSRLANEFKMEYTAFIKTWCRWIPFERDSERLSLKEKSNFDCIFWNRQCTVYRARPLQCRTFPFWDNVVCSPSAWETAGSGCPGLNTGKRHTGEKINRFLRMMEKEPVIERKVTRMGGGKC
jgi:Fe-S-cluster containining protein